MKQQEHFPDSCLKDQEFSGMILIPRIKKMPIYKIQLKDYHG